MRLTLEQILRDVKKITDTECISYDVDEFPRGIKRILKRLGFLTWKSRNEWDDVICVSRATD